MRISFAFIFYSFMLGVGLAMDAFSVSVANGLSDSGMNRSRLIRIAACFAFFQFIMPLAGWVCLHTVVEYFSAFQKYIPWIALILLVFIGSRMILEAFRGGEEKDVQLGRGELLAQGVATSIDALSVGFTIADYDLRAALTASSIIALVTFCLCAAGVRIGMVFRMHLSRYASILGGLILIGIGIAVFIR